MLPFIDEIDDNANTVCHVSEDDGEEESSCSDLNHDIPTNNDDPTAGNEIRPHWTLHQRKRDTYVVIPPSSNALFYNTKESEVAKTATVPITPK